jgi:F-type H+-transporting ATPase subunit gamma
MAGNLIFLRRRIKSVKNTQKLTKAMKTVAAAKLRRSTSELKRSRPYRAKITQLLQETGKIIAPAAQPLLRTDGKGASVLVVVASDKGLCGAFNSHVLKQAEARYRELAAADREAILITIGTKASRYFRKRGLEPKKSYNGLISRLQFADAVRIAVELQELFLNGGAGSVEFAFIEYITASKQQFVVRSLLPVALDGDGSGGSETTGSAAVAETIFEPGAGAIFQALLPRFITASVYQFLLQSMAAEQVARMVAMDLATRNASDMIRQLTLLLNKMRQAAITKELLEIITATEAMNQ